MTSKRDVQFVRLACRWRWLTAEQGEECLALERKLAGKHSVEEIIRRQGYLDEDKLASLREAAEEHGARRRPLFRRSTEASEAPSAELEPPRREQTVVRAIDYIPAGPPEVSPRSSRRPRPAGPTLQRVEEAVPPATTLHEPRAFRRAPSHVIANASTVVGDPSEQYGSALGAQAPVAQVPVSREPSEARPDPLAEPVHPREPSFPAYSDDATRVEMSPFFEGDSSPRLAEPELPPSARRGPIARSETRFDPGLPASLDEPLRPGAVAGGAVDLLVEQAITDARAPAASVADADLQERTVMAELPAELLSRLRGPAAHDVDPSEPDEEEVDVTMIGFMGGEGVSRDLPTPDLPTPDLTPMQVGDTDELTAPVTPSVRRSSVPTARALSPAAEPAPPRVDPATPIHAKPDVARPGAARPIAPRGVSVVPVTGARPASQVRVAAERAGSLNATSPIEDDPPPPASLLESPEQAEALLGDFGPYRLERVIARGQQSVVFLGRDPATNARVTVKVLGRDPAENQAFISARGGVLIAAASIRSPYVVRVLDVGRVDAQHYVTLEHVDGWTLADKLTFESAPTPARAFAWAGQVAEGLAAAWRGGLAHGDVTPDRVLIDPVSRARLTGFGFSPMEPRDVDPHAPPEGRSLDAACDAYGLGCVLEVALGGRDAVRALPSELPADAAALLASLLAEDPAARPTDFAWIAERLAECSESLATSGAPRQEARRPPVRGLLLRSLGFAGLLVMVTLAVSALPSLMELDASAVASLVLHTALLGSVGLSVATLLSSTLDLIRRGELPLPVSTQWLVQVGEGAGLVGALAVVMQLMLGPPAIMHVLLALLGAALACSAVIGVGLRRSVARSRPDRGVGRILAVLSDPWLIRWRAWHGLGLTTVTFLAVGRFALLAYFASS